MKEKYESLSLATLKDLAKARGLKGISTMRKPELIERMLEEDKKEQTAENEQTISGTAEENTIPARPEYVAAEKQKIREVFLHRREERHQPDPVPLYGAILSIAAITAIIMAEVKIRDVRTAIMEKTDRRTL